MATIVYESHPRGGQTATITISADTSDWVLVPTANVGLDLIVTSGSAVVQQCSASLSEIEADTAVPFAWSNGTVTANSSSALYGGSAVRLTGSGVSTLYVRFD